MLNIPKVTVGYVTKNIDKARQLSSNITSEIRSTGKYYYGNAALGWQTAGRLSDIKHFSSVKKLSLRIANTLSKTKVKQDHIPTILGGIGAISPVPGGCVIGYALGKFINWGVKLIK